MIELKGTARAPRRVLGAVLALAAIAAAPLASADTILVEASPLISGTQSNVYSLAAPSAGSVTVSLSNLGWPERLASLSFALATSSGVLKTFSGEGQQTFDLGSAGTYYAIVTGKAQGHWDLGMYSLRMSFSALSGPGGPAVPLPAAAWLLLSGIAGVFGLMRWKQELPPAGTPAY
jgi:hypothetical protein